MAKAASKKTYHATQFLNDEKTSLPPILVCYGKERFLKQSVLNVVRKTLFGDSSDDEFGETSLTGKDAELKSVLDELKTVSMWGSARLVVIDDADDFVSKNRAGLEKFAASPAKKSILILYVKTWPGNTKLAKIVAKTGQAIDCSELSGSKLNGWLMSMAETKHEKQLSGAAAQLLAELAGNGLGLLERELAKLSDYVGDNTRITPDDVRTLVGGWKAETTWTMTNAIRDGQIGVAMTCLDKLLVAGEAPQKLIGGITFVFRKYADAVLHAKGNTSVSAALKAAGVFPRDLGPAEQYLRRIGRQHAEKIFSILLTADTNLKGGSSIPGRLQMEQLVMQLAGQVEFQEEYV